jgi:hypothetical protein
LPRDRSVLGRTTQIAVAQGRFEAESVVQHDADDQHDQPAANGTDHVPISLAATCLPRGVRVTVREPSADWIFRLTAPHFTQTQSSALA